MSVSRTAVTLRRSAARFSNSCAVVPSICESRNRMNNGSHDSTRRLARAQKQEVAAFDVHATSPASVRATIARTIGTL